MTTFLGRLVPLLAALPLVGGQLSFDAAAAEGEFLYYRPHSQPLRYVLSVTTRSQADALFEPGPREERTDTISLSQKVEAAGEGLLDIVLTVDDINLRDQRPKAGAYQLNPRGGSAYERRDILGNSGHTLVNHLGAVREMRGIPHFGSLYFHPDSLTGAALDLYRALAMLYPEFPLRLLTQGDRWKVKNQIPIRSAEALPIRGIATLKHDLTMTVDRDIDYEVVGYVQKGQFKTVHVRFRGTFAMDGKMALEGGTDYLAGSGTSAADLYFALGEGVLVEASMKSEVNERKSQDGEAVHWFNATQSMALSTARRTTEITWLTEQDLHFALADR